MAETRVPSPLRFSELEDRVRAAVERVAATDPNPHDPFRGLYITDELAVALAHEDSGIDLDGRLQSIAELLDLDELDARVLAICLAPELDPRFGRLFGYLQDDVTRRRPTPWLVARLLSDGGGEESSVLQRFGREGRLRSTGALQLTDPDGLLPLAERPIKVAERVVVLALGSSLDDNGMSSRCRLIEAEGPECGRAGVRHRLADMLRTDSRLALVVAGPDAADILAASAGSPLLVAKATVITEPGALAELRLEAHLSGALLCFELDDGLGPAEGAQLAAELGRLTPRSLICAPSRAATLPLQDLHAITVEVPLPSFEERLTLWSDCAPAATAVDEVAAKFRLSAGQITHAVEVARLQAVSRGHVEPDAVDLHHGARQASNRRLEELAVRIEPTDRWGDLILPERQLESLKAISAHLRHRDLVLSGWGYDRVAGEGQGIKVLFFGESGTGKTMAGRVLGHELGLDIYRVDLATVVSKYIGETEKNLDRIFEAANGSNAILFFDEADALFGKRSEVSDAHDRYANIEVAYLLQKMEGYPGAVILATNFRSNMDDAFLRRLDFAVEFPFPEAEQRAAIWRRVLPDMAPVAEDVAIDVLAERYKLSGGSIRNSALAGAFLAADEGGRIEMRHLMRGVAAEYVKLGRLTVGSDFVNDGGRSGGVALP